MESLDVSCNRIATLPVELRLMKNLVNLVLDSNPLTSPPASVSLPSIPRAAETLITVVVQQLCVRGLVHVFKFLDTVATKDEKSRTGSNFDGHATLRRNAVAKQNAAVSELQKMRRQNIDSGYSTSDGLDKRWSQEMPPANGGGENGNAKWSPTPMHIRTGPDRNSPTHAPSNSSPYLSRSGVATPLLSPAGNNNVPISAGGDEFKRPPAPTETSTPKRSLNGSNSNRYEEGSCGPEHEVCYSFDLILDSKKKYERNAP